MIIVGRFSIHGDWDPTPTPDGLLRIIIPPLGHIWGAGWQPHTQAALLALPNLITPGRSFGDVGCGSGILCVAAKLLGAGKCYASELNPDALEAAKRTFAANNMDVELINGTFLPEVDVLSVSISDEFIKENRDQLRGVRLLFIHDDATAEVL